MDTRDLINQHLESVLQGAPTTVELAKMLTDDGAREQLSITFARGIDTPVRAESPARSHRFASRAGFVAYLGKNGTAAMVVMADAETGRMAAVLDETKGTGFEVVTFQPIQHPLYSIWSDRYGKPGTLKELAQFVMANRDIIKAPARDSLVANFKHVYISKSVEITDGVGVDSMQAVVCHTKIQGKEGDKVTNLPQRITLECPMFIGGKPMEIHVDLLFEVGRDDRILVTLTSADAEVKQLATIEKMLDDVTADLKDKTGVLVALGQLNYESWRYINRQSVPDDEVNYRDPADGPRRGEGRGGR